MKPILFVLLCAVLLNACSEGSSDSVSPGAGTGGSTARFTVAGNNLYIVTNTSLQAYDITQNTNPKLGQKTKLGFGVETIFPYGNHLFIGTQTGMFIYAMGPNGQPSFVSQYNHVMSCDPVVVQGNYAYVTLRSGTACRNPVAANVLDVLDITDLRTPKLMRSYPMRSPHGLGIDGNLLFVTEGDYGLRVLDATKPLDIREVQFLTDVKAYDVIPKQQRLIVTGKDGIYQYSYADEKQLKLISKLPVETTL
ncbi:hypothetical protein DYU11_22280 [Fibrisoma montanum]|uniref:LVIVD repeat-containing protein n=1 Tax=Fibrisoma montanum TaxID=2305895 RepID=A0A418M4T7_9BACT|nr:hypothetical protein [Fibrisoma montanum]RIV20761.1 hypothetical protein DYU11_22280 [Fibrisoma montanum]